MQKIFQQIAATCEITIFECISKAEGHFEIGYIAYFHRFLALTFVEHTPIVSRCFKHSPVGR
jgi:hypothetical protein